MSHLYVSCRDDNRIAVFHLCDENGALTRKEDVRVAGGPAPMTTHPSHRWLFVGRRADNHLASYRLDAATGGVTLINAVKLESDPCYIATDRSGQFLFSAYYAAGLVGVHRIEAYGALVPDPIEWRTTDKRAHCMQADPSNRFVFVPHIANHGGANAIFQFRFDETSGKLNPNSPERVVPPLLDGPRHLCFHPSRPLVYCSNEQGSSVTTYDLDVTSGTLAARQTVPTLPSGFDGENTCSQIQITPGGEFLYAPNRGHDSIAIFEVEGETGLLSKPAHQSTERIPELSASTPRAGMYLSPVSRRAGSRLTGSIKQTVR